MNNTNTSPYLFFWGHQPKKDGSASKSCLSQWYPSPISGNYPPQGTQEEYPTAEHFMMAEKARLFNDQKTRQHILQATSPQEAKMLGRTIKNFDEKIWEEHRYDIVLKVTREKFLQNHSLRAFLYSTRGSTLVEASPVDTVWGIGLSVDDAESRDPKKWRGLNLLGKALTHVRDELYSHAIVLPISENQSLEIDFCAPLETIDFYQNWSPIWFVNYYEPRFDIVNHFIDWKEEMMSLHTLVTTALNEINNTDNTVTINLAEWSTWVSHNTPPIITVTKDIAHLWLQRIDIILKVIYAEYV